MSIKPKTFDDFTAKQIMLNRWVSTLFYEFYDKKLSQNNVLSASVEAGPATGNVKY